MSSIHNDRSQERLRQMQGDGERNYSAAALGVGGAGSAQPQERTPEDPVSVSLKMEIMAQSVVDSNHKVSSAISFVQMQKEVLAKFSNGFQRIAELRNPGGDPIDAGQAPRDAFRNIVTGFPKTDNIHFNGEPLFNAPPLRVSFHINEPEPGAVAVDLDRPDLQPLTKVQRPQGVPVPLINVELDQIPDDWLDETIARIADLVYTNGEDVERLSQVRNSLNVAPDTPDRELLEEEIQEISEDVGRLLLSSLDTGNAYLVQTRLSPVAVANLLK